MAVELKRGCGYRKVGGLYLVGNYIPVACDRLPLEVGSCPVCGSGVHWIRNIAEINPYRLWGVHMPCIDHLCKVCQPPDDVAFIMGVGERHYSPSSFLEEAVAMGVSKRIPAIPKKLKLGETVVYLAHKKAVEVRESLAVQQAMGVLENIGNPQMRLLEAEGKPTYKMGIFCAFIPQRVEKLIWEKEATEENMEALRKRGIEPVIIPDGDEDHC